MKVWGRFIEITLSVCQFKILVKSTSFFYGETLKGVTSHKDCLHVWPENSCLVHIFLMEEHWKFLLHTNVSYNLDPRSFWQGQLAEILFKYCLWPEGMSRFWPKVIQSKSRSLEEKVYNPCRLCTVFMEKHWKFLS